MPHSSTVSNHSRSTSTPDRSLSSTPNSILSSAATSILAPDRLIPKPVKRPVIKSRKTKPKSHAGDWGQLLGVPPDHTPGNSNNSSRRSSLHTADSHADLIGQADLQEDKAPHAMGGSRTSVSMNGGMDSKRRTMSYEEQYQYKDNAYGSARERVHRESPVIAELRTNVIIKDEFTLVTDMSYHLAARYSRPDSSIMINVDHSSCLALAGTFEPCYILTISVVPSQMQATTNKRNAALIQSFMADILSVPSERGILKFVSVPEENFACNGNTLFGEIERLEQQQLGNGNGGAKRAITDVRKSMPAFSSKKSIPKIDTESAKKADQADGIDGHVQELESGAVAAPLKPQSRIPDVFEFAGPQTDSDRPATSQGTSSIPNFAALNGLRLNGITKEDLEGPGSRTSFGRPKTVAGGPVHSSTDGFDLMPRPRRGSDEGGAPAPVVKSEPRQQLKDSRKNTLQETKSNSRSSTPVQKHTPASNLASPIEKTKPAYLDTPSKSSLAKSHSRSKSKSQSPPEALPQDANTAKRRSTVTATPSSNSNRAPKAPPVPESKPAKISKRKSFFSVFK